MRLRPQDLQKIFLRKRVNKSDAEGNPIKGWDEAILIRANVQPASGQLNASIYGERLQYMKNIKYQGDDIMENRDEGSGICLNVKQTDDPDYKIISIQTFAMHKNILIEKRVTGANGD